MSLERKPAARPAAEPAPRTLKPSANPAQRLQELLRRESQQAREMAAPVVTEAPAVVAPDVPPPAPPPVAAGPVTPPEPVTLIVLVNSERSTPTEYPSVAEMPTGAALQEAHGAFLLSDEWQRRGGVLTRTVRLRRRRRR